MAPGPVDQGILSSLESFETQLFASLKGGDDALSNYLSTWEAFEKKLSDCVHILQVETAERVYDFSSMVSAVVQGFAKALSLVDGIKLEAPELLDISTASGSSYSAAGPSPHPFYLEVACKWLIANIHDPYPSLDLRASMAAQTGCPRKDIDNWFLDARKRIGWNDMRRRLFDNKRVRIVDAARRFFLDTDPSRPLERAVENQFATIQLRALDLYSSKFEESPLALQLDRLISNSTPIADASAGRRKPRTSKMPSPINTSRYYPTPEPSPVSPRTPPLSPTPSLSERSSANSKHTASSSESEERDESVSIRGKSSTVEEAPPATEVDSNSLPPPAEPIFDNTEIQQVPHHASTTDTSPPFKRKRQLSNSIEDQPELKRPHNDSAPLLHEATSLAIPIISPPTTGGRRLFSQLTSPISGEAGNIAPPRVPKRRRCPTGGIKLWTFLQFPPPVCDFTSEITGPVDVSLFEFPQWDSIGYDASSIAPGPVTPLAGVGDVDVTGYAAQTTELPTSGAPAPHQSSSATGYIVVADDLFFDWNPYGSTYSPSQKSPGTNGSSLSDLLNTHDFPDLADQYTTSISLPQTYGRLPAFPDPSYPTTQEAAQETTVTIPQSILEAKEEQIRSLQAMVAALTTPSS
ncbi:hypothetical protein NMY22_g3358 [Coprinellus aureogranulatus]|nr:hypothetical protein NMY22_g3358 [Coprinellus aureogranulatus]